MGLCLFVDNDRFLRKCESSETKVILVRNVGRDIVDRFLSGRLRDLVIPRLVYIVRDGDYYFHTSSLEPLELPSGTEVETVSGSPL